MQMFIFSESGKTWWDEGLVPMFYLIALHFSLLNGVAERSLPI